MTACATNIEVVAVRCSFFTTSRALLYGTAATKIRVSVETRGSAKSCDVCCLLGCAQHHEPAPTLRQEAAHPAQVNAYVVEGLNGLCGKTAEHAEHLPQFA